MKVKNIHDFCEKKTVAKTKEKTEIWGFCSGK